MLERMNAVLYYTGGDLFSLLKSNKQFRFETKASLCKITSSQVTLANKAKVRRPFVDLNFVSTLWAEVYC